MTMALPAEARTSCVKLCAIAPAGGPVFSDESASDSEDRATSPKKGFPRVAIAKPSRILRQFRGILVVRRFRQGGAKLKRAWFVHSM